MDIEKINVGGTQYDVCDTVARAAVSDEFSTGATYAAGDYCIYENTLYKFTAAKEPGAWDASKVAATQIGDELSQLNGNFDFGNTRQISNANNATKNLCLYTLTGSTNSPTSDGVWYGIFVLAISATNFLQIAFPLSASTQIYLRKNINGEWGTWHEK